MIKGSCFTNLDGYQVVDWPTRFVAVPSIGDRVQGRMPNSDDDYENTTKKRNLFVASVTHLMIKGEPCIEVELSAHNKNNIVFKENR